jgi:hypothetical protein
LFLLVGNYNCRPAAAYKPAKWRTERLALIFFDEALYFGLIGSEPVASLLTEFLVPFTTFLFLLRVG